MRKPNESIIVRVLVMLAVAVCAVERTSAQVVVEPPGATVAGKTIAEWSTNWWRWALALAPPGDPFTDTTGQFASVNQSGPVFFLAGSPGGSRSRQFEVPTNTYILVPLLVGEFSQLELGFDKTAAQIRQAAQQQANQIDSLHATLDGTNISQATLLTYRQASPDFNFVAVANNQLGVPAGDSGIAVADGYFLMLDPLPPGTYVLNYGGGASAFGVFIDETDTISVGGPPATPPTITRQPTNQTVQTGQNAVLAVSAFGSPVLSYQWYFNGVALTNANADTLAFTAEPGSAGYYWVTISNLYGRVTSSLAFLTVLPDPGDVVVVEPPGATVAGKTIAEWSTNWWRWALALAPPGDPFTDFSGEFAGVNQSGPVFFLAGSPGGSRSRWFEVPTNTYVLIPLLVGEWSQLELGFNKTAAEIRQAAQQQADQFNSLHATLDGVPIPQATLFTHRQASPDFNFVAVFNNQLGVPSGASGIAVADGYFLMLAPLPPGVHVLTYGGGASAFGISISETDTITVGAPKITMQPTNQTVLAEQAANFAVSAIGSSPLSYQWYYSPFLVMTNGLPLGMPLSNANTSALTFTATPSSVGHYWVTVSNIASRVTSSTAFLSVLPNPPTITAQPVDQAVFTGSNAMFSVSVTTTNPPLRFQWQYYGTNLFQATNDTLTISNAQVANIGEYRVVVSDSIGFTNSTPAWLTLLDLPPFITSQPTGLVVPAGSNASFTVTAEGGALSYQWRFNGDFIPGATGSTLVINNAQPGDIGSYAVVITNNYGAVTSSIASLRLLAWLNNNPANQGHAIQAVAVDSSGNLVVTGYSTNTDYYTAKFAAADGALLWEKYYSSGFPAAVAVDANDNVVVTGSSGYWDGGHWVADYLTVKYAAVDGALLWEKRYNGPVSGDDYPFALAVDGAGNVTVTGYSFNGTADYYTAKYAADDGTLLWQRYYDGSARDTAQAVAVDSSGNVVVTGYVWNGSNDDCYTAKYAAANGALLWGKTYNGPGNGDDRFEAVVIDSSNNVVLTGGSGVWPNGDCYTVKYGAADGALLWEKRGPSGGARAVALDSSGNVVITGTSAAGDYYTAKYAAANGSLLWEKRHNSPANDYDYASAVALDGSGNVIVTGNSAQGGSYTAAYRAADGTLIWDYSNAGSAIDLAVDSQGNAIVAGSYLVKILAGLSEIPSYRFNSIAFTNGSVQLDWTPAPGLVLQRTASLNTPNWQSVAGSMNTNRIAVPATNASGFFRLVKP